MSGDYLYLKKEKKWTVDIKQAIIYPNKELARAKIYTLDPKYYNIKIKRIPKYKLTARQRGKAIAKLRYVDNEKEQI